MTKEEIIEMAKQADIDIGMWEKLSDNDDVFGYDFCGIHENLEAFAKLVAENARELGLNYERGFIDGMQKQMQSSVDKAVNRMAQPEQEPVAWEQFHEHMAGPFYTAPPQRTWVGLTDEDDIDWEDGGNLKDLVKAIEAKLKEKNNV